MNIRYLLGLGAFCLVMVSAAACATGGCPRIKTDKDAPQVIKECTEYLQDHPEDAQALCNRGEAWLAAGRPRKAMKDLDRSLGIDQEQPLAFFYRGNAFLDLRTYPSAAGDFSRVIAMWPEASAAYNNRGLALERMGDNEKALADYKKAIELDPDNQVAKRNERRVRKAQAELLSKKQKEKEEARRKDLIQKAISGNNRFSLELYAHLSRTEPGSFICSPYSVVNNLALALPGTQGNTQAQMAWTLHAQGGVNNYILGQRFLAQSIASSGDTQDQKLIIANGIWLQKGMKLLPAYESLIKESFQVTPQFVDFSRPGDAAKQINAWVARNTQGMIGGLVEPGSLQDKLMFMGNAVYFLGRWKHPFHERDTKEDKFWLTPRQHAPVKLMNQQRYRIYYENDRFQAVRIPYLWGEGDRLSMIVFLPRDKDGLPALEKEAQSAIAAAHKGFELEIVNLFLPRFGIDSTFSLKDALLALGLKDAFNPMAADFRAMSRGPEVMIGGMEQKAVIKVHEKGTEVAAASGLRAKALVGRSIDPKIYTFRADHPFFFTIEQEKTGCIVFMGRFAGPASR